MLLQVYEAMGERWDWEEGGRGLEMPEACWTLLENDDLLSEDEDEVDFTRFNLVAGKPKGIQLSACIPRYRFAGW